MPRPTLLWPGTRVSLRSGDITLYGIVQEYEHYSASQETFPVQIGSQWRIVTSRDVTALPASEQTLERHPPRRTGRWANEAAAVLAHRPTLVAVHNTTDRGEESRGA